MTEAIKTEDLVHSEIVDGIEVSPGFWWVRRKEAPILAIVEVREKDWQVMFEWSPGRELWGWSIGRDGFTHKSASVKDIAKNVFFICKIPHPETLLQMRAA